MTPRPFVASFSYLPALTRRRVPGPRISARAVVMAATSEAAMAHVEAYISERSDWPPVAIAVGPCSLPLHLLDLH